MSLSSGSDLEKNSYEPKPWLKIWAQAQVQGSRVAQEKEHSPINTVKPVKPLQRPRTPKRQLYIKRHHLETWSLFSSRS